mgnify:CR=1 FL=1
MSSWAYLDRGTWPSMPVIRDVRVALPNGSESIRFTALADTGAEISTLDMRHQSVARLVDATKSEIQRLYFPNGQSMEYSTVQVRVQIDGVNLGRDVVKFALMKSFIIGRDILNQLDAHFLGPGPTPSRTGTLVLEDFSGAPPRPAMDSGR